MAEFPIDERDLEVINAKMAEHVAFKPGMRAVARQDRLGYDIEGGHDAAAIFGWAKTQIERQQKV